MKAHSLHLSVRISLQMLLLTFLVPAYESTAASTLRTSEISNFPVATELDNEGGGSVDTSFLVKPNIAFIVDDSGSMDEQNMPNGDRTNKGSACYGWYGYNTLAYNPNTTYKPPYKPDGEVYTDGVTRYPDSVFTSALEDGYFPNDGVTFNHATRRNQLVNLRTSIKLPYSSYPNDSTSIYYATPRNTSDYSRTTCLSNSSYNIVTDRNNIEAPGVTRGSDAALTNYANWYSYYRRRAYLMKAAAGEAFKDVDGERFRVGLLFINSRQSGASQTNNRNNDLKIDDFTGEHRTQWFETLYGGRGNGWTPLRGALSRIGRMYAGKVTGWDPVQYSCQQNYAILSTDGYWNDDGENNSYGPHNIHGNNVGDVDTGSNISRPYKDRDRNGQANTLADIAYHYYTTDLRNDALNNCRNTDDENYTGLCKDNVPENGRDKNRQQHMVTHTIGLGVSGTILYEANYENASDIRGVTQYFDILNGTANWPHVTVSSDTDTRKIDDLWHAAVNGRGRYYSAKDVDSLYGGIQSILSEIKARPGSASAAATSTMEPVQGDNAAYMAQYRTVNWDGDVMAGAIDPTTGNVSRDETHWSAKRSLDSQQTRLIKFFSANTGTDNLKDFYFDNLDEDLKPHFQDLCDLSRGVSQCISLASGLTDAQKSTANSGTNLVNYLRGSSQYEDKDTNATETNRLYRGRAHLLGDIVHSSPLYVRDSRFLLDKPHLETGYLGDPTYTQFKNSQSARVPTVYVGANDGMLHAFNADNGQERWAYVPRMVMPHMWQLADRNYASRHRYFVDGSPTAMDICKEQDPNEPLHCASASDWRTILVGGLNKGGCGVYALDITNPRQPKGLWEFTDRNLGYSYGTPVIVRNKEGKWIVAFTSGYNNSQESRGEGECQGQNGDGNGYVYILDAFTGEPLDDSSYPIPTKIGGEPVGTPEDPSNLGKLNAWMNPYTFVADRLYVGDMKGNLWRIDFDGNYGEKKATRLAALKDSEGKAQPITTRPELAASKLGHGLPTHDLVMVGTGKLLGTGDLTYIEKQSFYVLKDDLAETGIANVRGNSILRKTLTQHRIEEGDRQGQLIRRLSSETMDWNDYDGWLMDFDPNNLSPGERVNIDMEYQAGKLFMITNVPDRNACNAGGYSWLYMLHAASAGGGDVGIQIPDNALAAGVKVVRLPNGQDVVIITLTNGETITINAGPSSPSFSSTPKRRVAWRELID